MEGLVLEDSPLAKYFEGNGQEDNDDTVALNPPCPSFAPKGRPILSRFQRNVPSALWQSIPRHHLITKLHNAYSRTLDSRPSQTDNARFLERFRYLIVASQLLSSQPYPAHSGAIKSQQAQAGDALQLQAFSSSGAVMIALSVFVVSWLIHWTRSGAGIAARKCRIAVLVIVVGTLGMMSYTYLHRQWLQRLRQETLVKLSHLITAYHDLDNVASNVLLLIQEVELVSRGYQISHPLSPISRMEDRIQIRRCSRLRKHFRVSFLEVLPKLVRACNTLRPLAEELDLEKYFEIYEINNTDLTEAFSDNWEPEYDELESVRVLKVLAARYNTTRKVFLCCLMALNADESKNDFNRWNTTMREIQEIRSVSVCAGSRLAKILNEKDHFSIPPTPKVPLSPGRERRVQSRQLSTLSSGIRGLQAKLHVLREESDRQRDDSEDVSEIISNFMIQYESLGNDLKALMNDWEEGKISLDIERNERRKSSTSGFFSPTTSLGGLTVVEEGSALEALQDLTGEYRSRYSLEMSSSDLEEVFEAVANPRSKITLSRAERIAKMKDDRVARDSLKSSRDENTKMLRELKSVIQMRPRSRQSLNIRNSSI